jgi:DNA-binding winged helix-turn-helix (wHTH) protein/dienelactone hydrolase
VARTTMPANTSTSSATHRTYSFGEFTLDLDRGALLKAGADIKLRPKSFEMLSYLVERHGLLVAKNELLDALWGRTVVSEDAVNQCVTDIRRALRDRSQKTIRTVPKRGYIFDLPVEAHGGPGTGSDTPSRRKIALSWPGWALAAALGLMLGVAAVWWGFENRRVTDRRVLWATQQLLEIDRLQDRGEFGSAFALASEVEPLLAEDAISDEVWDSFSWSSDIETDPTGAPVYRQSVDAAPDEWEDLGITPLTTVRFAQGAGYRLRLELRGHRTVELLQTAIRGIPFIGLDPVKPIRLDPVDALPEEMVRIPGFTRDQVDYADYFMDRFEVTNRDYDQFVAAGGYEMPEYWTHDFEREGKAITWDEAVNHFVDRTGRPGPSTWSGGAYPTGQGDYPVSGVSWYEAAAYARFVNKELPTSIHHRNARRFYRSDSWLIAPRSNLGGDGPRPVGENRAMTTMGVYDLAGNVREWCWNEAGKDARVTIGGAWTDAPFHVGWIIPRSPWDRDSTHGFRLVRSFDDDEKLATLRGPREPRDRRDYRKEEPASDPELMIYRRLYAYDSLPLNAEVVAADEFEHWTREQVAFDLPYGERGGALLYIPNNVDPPFEAVIFWGGSGILSKQSVDEESLGHVSFLVRSGRAVARPIFKGAYERDDPDFGTTHASLRAQSEGTKFRDYQIKWVQDLSRTIDYLETREDFKTDTLGYYGHSWGGAAAPIVLAVEERIDAAVLNVGGLNDRNRFLPEADPLNYLTGVRSPVLMLNGEYDIVFPLETSQIPMFELLGTDPKHKKHYVTPSSHVVPHDVLIRETLDWFDRYLDGARD